MTRWRCLSTLFVWGIAVGLFGCHDDGQDDDDTVQDEDPPVDFESVCDGTWVSDECAQGNCYDSDVEQRYGEVWSDWFPIEMGLTSEEMSEFVHLRRVNTFEAQQSSYTDLYYQLQLDWLPVVEWMAASAPGGDPSEEEVLAAWSDWASFPQADFYQDLISPSAAIGALEQCEAEQGVQFSPTGWCEASIPTNPGTENGVSVQFRVDIDSYHYVEAFLRLVSGEIDCRLREVDID